ncbi:oligosaccharide flippase family protein [Priestia megaterium]|uniref:oligosaccharide flippase family protein n=1 Tax=Priestia megaterium TaxID=1404 RepID=UPI001F143973|nr:oligosaccharide flippase family protein [Priestia megaterium]UMZ34203.1 oligosaccharide flippase family protein [Priestia megaterium]
MISKSLVRKSGLYFVGNLSSKVMSGLLIPIYAFYVNANDLGYFDFSQTVMGVASPIIILAIWEAVLKFVLSEDNIQTKERIIATSAIFSIFMACLVGVSTFLFSLAYANSIRYLNLIVTMIILHSLVYVWQYNTRALKENKLFVVSGVVSTIVNFISVILLVVIMKQGLLGLIVSYNVGQLSIIIVIERKIRVIRKLKFKNFDFNILKRMLSFSTPLVFNLISAWLISGIGRIIITAKLGTEQNGIYSFANKFSLIVTMIGTVITMAIVEEAIISVKKKGLDSNFNKTLEGLFKIFQYFSLLALPSIVVFYKVIGSTDYYESLYITPWLLMYAVANTMASNFGTVFQAIDKTKYQFLTTLIGGIVTVIISFSFINLLGVSAVIIGQICGAILMMLSRYVLINQFTEMRVNWLPILLRSVLFILVTIVCINVSTYTNILIEILLTLIIFYLNKNIIKMGWSKIKGRGK